MDLASITYLPHFKSMSMSLYGVELVILQNSFAFSIHFNLISNISHFFLFCFYVHLQEQLIVIFCITDIMQLSEAKDSVLIIRNILDHLVSLALMHLWTLNIICFQITEIICCSIHIHQLFPFLSVLPIPPLRAVSTLSSSVMPYVIKIP